MISTCSNQLCSLIVAMLLFSTAIAQDINLLQKEAINLEKQLNEKEALDKYKQIATMSPGNIPVLVKCTELHCSIGARQPDKNNKATYYKAGNAYAQKAIAIDSNNAEANYAMALVAGKLTEVEEEKKKIVEYVNQTKHYDDRALKINPSHAKANYIMGKWHYEIVNLPWIKKAAVKALYGKLPKGDIDSAIAYMEKCRMLDQYFMRNYLDLAKAYQYKNQPAKAIDILNRLVKLPIRTADDPALKEEGKKMLDELL